MLGPNQQRGTGVSQSFWATPNQFSGQPLGFHAIICCTQKRLQYFAAAAIGLYSPLRIYVAQISYVIAQHIQGFT
jgi:hypothetical protein